MAPYNSSPTGEANIFGVQIPPAGSGEAKAEPRVIAERLRDEIPELGYVISNVQFSLAVTYGRFFKLDPPQAALQVTGQAVNDFVDLMVDLYDARGRSATRTARALIEHLVNLSDVSADTDSASRYLDHFAVGALVEADAAIGLDLMRASERKAEIHRLKKLRRMHEVAATTASSSYGSRYRMSWAKSSLRDRAAQHGLTAFYDYYRLASHVLHGSATGERGSVQQIGGKRIHRLGPALALLPSAYCEGVRAFKEIVHIMSRLTPQLNAAELDQWLTVLLAGWPHYRRAVNRVDRWLWPAYPPSGPHAVLAVARDGRRRWYCHDPDLGIIAEATAPEPGQLTQSQEYNIEDIVAKGVSGLIADEDRWLTIAVAGVVVVPLPGAIWVPSAGILVPATSGRHLLKPLKVDLRTSQSEERESSP